jgi:hypothetical protein
MWIVRGMWLRFRRSEGYCPVSACGDCSLLFSNELGVLVCPVGSHVFCLREGERRGCC